jgi:hypothetical protein
MGDWKMIDTMIQPMLSSMMAEARMTYSRGMASTGYGE